MGQVIYGRDFRRLIIIEVGVVLEKVKQGGRWLARGCADRRLSSITEALSHLCLSPYLRLHRYRVFSRKFLAKSEGWLRIAILSQKVTTMQRKRKLRSLCRMMTQQLKEVRRRTDSPVG
jgi:hypothetical protein